MAAVGLGHAQEPPGLTPEETRLLASFDRWLQGEQLKPDEQAELDPWLADKEGRKLRRDVFWSHPRLLVAEEAFAFAAYSGVEEGSLRKVLAAQVQIGEYNGFQVAPGVIVTHTDVLDPYLGEGADTEDLLELRRFRDMKTGAPLDARDGYIALDLNRMEVLGFDELATQFTAFKIRNLSPESSFAADPQLEFQAERGLTFARPEVGERILIPQAVWTVKGLRKHVGSKSAKADVGANHGIAN